MDNLASIISEKKSGKRMKKEEKANESNIFDRVANEQSAVVPKCNSCNRLQTSSESFSKCGRCKEMFYCGRECQKKGWSSHRSNCMPK